MGRFYKILFCFGFVAVALLVLSWETNTYPEYCETKDDCANYNLLPFVFIQIAEFLHRFESFFLVAFTAALALFTWQLRDSTDRLWEAGEKQREVSEKSLEKAHEANAFSRALGEAEIRAYLHIEKINLVWGTLDPAVGHPPLEKFEINWKNRGQTPASQLGFDGGIVAVSKGDETIPVEVKPAMESWDVSTVELGINEEFSPGWEGCTSEEVAAWRAGQKDLIVYCACNYRDVFGKLCKVMRCTRLDYNGKTIEFAAVPYGNIATYGKNS